MITDLALRMVIALRGLAENTSDDDGQTLAEYGLIMSVIGVAVVVLAVVSFRDAIAAAFDAASDCLDGSC